MKIGDAIVAAFCIILMVITIKSCYRNHEKEQALNQCIEDISNKCRRSIGYAIALETENARLNNVLKVCRVSENR